MSIVRRSTRKRLLFKIRTYTEIAGRLRSWHEPPQSVLAAGSNSPTRAERRHECISEPRVPVCASDAHVLEIGGRWAHEIKPYLIEETDHIRADLGDEN